MTAPEIRAMQRMILAAGGEPVGGRSIALRLLHGEAPGRVAWDCGAGNPALPGWPKCECNACDNPATGTDDGGNPVCDECREYAVDEDGDAHCATHSDDVEIVTESCGAGGQTRSYARLRPPGMPGEDPTGSWAVYWESGDDSHVVSRHTTQAEAEQAVAAHDWPPPGDHTRYLCGYGVRHLIAGEWLTEDEEEE